MKMSHHTAHAGEIPGTATRLPRLSVASSFAFALVVLGILGAVILMAHWSADGAAPAATLSVIGETFDKGF
jgi:hypothetical protein